MPSVDYREDIIHLPPTPPGRCPSCYQDLGHAPFRLARTTVYVCSEKCRRLLRGYLCVVKARNRYERLAREAPTMPFDLHERARIHAASKRGGARA